MSSPVPPVTVRVRFNTPILGFSVGQTAYLERTPLVSTLITTGRLTVIDGSSPGVVVPLDMSRVVYSSAEPDARRLENGDMWLTPSGALSHLIDGDWELISGGTGGGTPGDGLTEAQIAALITGTGTVGTATKTAALTAVRTSNLFLPVESVRLDDSDRSIAVLRVQVPITAPPPVDPEDPNVPVDPTPTPSPGTQIDALMPHPYYTPRTGDPYAPLPIDRPPSKNGVPVGKLAAPSLHNWPDETNTGLAVNNIAASALLPVAGTVEFTASGVTIGTTKYPRPATGSSTPVPGITMYPVGAGVAHPKHFAPVHNLVDHARVAGTVIQKGNLSTLVVDSMVVGTGGKGGWYNDVGGYGAGGIGQSAGFMVIVNSRVHGGRTAQSLSNGFRWWAHHCNLSGANDTFEPFTNCYADFNYTHGLIKVGSFHNDFCQITKCTGDPAVSTLFGGWNIRIRRNTGLSYGEKNGAQWLMLGNQQGDMDKVLVSENLGFGGVVMIGDGLGGYRSYGTNSDGTPITRPSSLTGKQETHAFTQYVVIERNVFGRKDADAWPGGGRPAGYKVPADRVADPGMYQYSGGGIWNDPPPYTLRDNVWDDTSTAACANGGHGYAAANANGWPTLEQVAVTQGLSFDVYPAGMPS